MSVAVSAEQQQTSPQAVHPVSDLQRYFRVLILGIVIFGASFGYISLLKTPNPLNKAMADTSIILIGLSMLLSSVCYFWNKLDSLIMYRKHLGIIGFVFGVVHIVLSFSSLQRLFLLETWERGAYWPASTGFVAAVIFAIMTIISNKLAATKLGGKVWRFLLRTGYAAVMLVLAHVVLLRLARWQTWFENGLSTPPSMSIIVSVFIVVVLVMRILLQIDLTKKAKKRVSSPASRAQQQVL